MESIIKQFLFRNSGYGYGYGHGSGYGSGSDDGYGYGYGSDDGSGYGIKMYNGKMIYIIDNIQTIFESIRGNYAKGYILNRDLTIRSCYIVKVGNYFAHGETLKNAVRDATSKYNENLTINERLILFTNRFKLKEKYPAKEFFLWHNTLTGSCELGRKEFCREKGINIDEDKFTVLEFIELTKNSYGGDIIKKLKY